MRGDKGHVLVVEDDPAVSQIIASALRPENFRVTPVTTIAARDAALLDGDFQLLITDIGLHDGDGLDSLDVVRRLHPYLPIIAISAQNSFDTAVRAAQEKIFEYLPKPFDIDELIAAAEQAVRHHSGSDGQRSAIEQNNLPLIGRSAAMQDVYRLITRLLHNDLSALILGESGTGKELVAKAIHDLGHRKAGPFVAINMAAIPSELIESELFGHIRGAFTGATSERVGRFEQAHLGTLFLDEIGDMPMPAQTRLLRTLQSGEIEPVGGGRTRLIDVRILAATNKNIPELIEQGLFREDLYYRINVVPVELPPLRDRAEDIDLLAEHFLIEAETQGLPRKRLDAPAKTMLRQMPWRGNVRELRNLMLRLAAMEREELLSERHIAGVMLDSNVHNVPQIEHAMLEKQIRVMASKFCQNDAIRGDIYARALAEFERPLIMAVLERVGGNQIKAAQWLGINRNTLRKKLTDYEIDPAEWRRSMVAGSQ
jgi:two-component system nitrogen regulation response regulator GlnG